MSERCLYHGTPVPIHLSDRPYLAPSAGAGRDLGDPLVPHVFGNPDKVEASTFALKTENTISIVPHAEGPIIVYVNEPPSKDASGWLYEISPDGFHETVAHGTPTGKFAMLAKDMPRVIDPDGRQVPGIPLEAGKARPVTLVELVQRENLRICFFPETYPRDEYKATAQKAAVLKRQKEFLEDGVAVGWLLDITDEYR